MDLDESTYESDMAQIEADKALIDEAVGSLKNSLTNLAYTKIISPVDGTVVSRSIDVGQTVAASFQTPTLFLVAKDLTKMQIDTTVAEADIGKIVQGQNITFTVDGYPDLIFKGKVRQIRKAPTTVSNVVTYDVVISVNNKELKLLPGMTANVSIVTAQKTNILLVPNASLRFTPDNDDVPKYKTHGIWMLRNGLIKRVSVKLGISDGTFTQILNADTLEGQKVVIEMLHKKRHGGGNTPPGGGMRGM